MITIKLFTAFSKFYPSNSCSKRHSCFTTTTSIKSVMHIAEALYHFKAIAQLLLFHGSCYHTTTFCTNKTFIWVTDNFFLFMHLLGTQQLHLVRNMELVITFLSLIPHESILLFHLPPSVPLTINFVSLMLTCISFFFFVAFLKLNFLCKSSIDLLISTRSSAYSIFIELHFHPLSPHLSLLRTKAVIIQSLDVLPSSQKLSDATESTFLFLRLSWNFIRRPSPPHLQNTGTAFSPVVDISFAVFLRLTRHPPFLFPAGNRTAFHSIPLSIVFFFIGLFYFHTMLK